MNGTAAVEKLPLSLKLLRRHCRLKFLVAGLENRDSISDLQRRLRSLPSDLEALYTHMVTLIDPFYLSKVSQIFQLVRTALELGSRNLNFSKQGRGSLAALELSF